MNTVGISIAIPALDNLENIKYAFTTRQNNLGARTSGVKTSEDWKAVAEAFGIGSDKLITLNQVHGETIVNVEACNYRQLTSLEADALITKERGIAIGVETADCVPILLLDPAVPAVGAVHAGWRSTVKKIVHKAVEKMQDEFGSDPSRIIAAIGPAIGPECYEVDEPVMGPVRETFSFWKEVSTPLRNDRWSLDLGKLNRLELADAGLPAPNIYSFGLCTSCNPDLFYSFRREGRTGRMLSVIMIKK